MLLGTGLVAEPCPLSLSSLTALLGLVVDAAVLEGVVFFSFCDTPLAGLVGGFVGGEALSAVGDGFTGDTFLGGIGSTFWVVLDTAGFDFTFTLRMLGFGRVGGFLGRELPDTSELVLEPADPVRLTEGSGGVSVLLVLEPKCEVFIGLTAADPLSTLVDTKPAKSALSVNSDLGVLLVMLILSGPLDSDPPLINIFWCGAEMAMGEVILGEFSGEP